MLQIINIGSYADKLVTNTQMGEYMNKNKLIVDWESGKDTTRFISLIVSANLRISKLYFGTSNR